MFDRIALWLDRQPPARRRLYSLLVSITLLTIPCYAAGLILYALSGPQPALPEPTPIGPAVTADTPSPGPDAYPTLIVRPTADQATEEVRPSPTMMVATATSTQTPILLASPTSTVTVQPTEAQATATATVRLEPTTPAPTSASATTVAPTTAAQASDTPAPDTPTPEVTPAAAPTDASTQSALDYS
jgi:hypothetical protein